MGSSVGSTERRPSLRSASFSDGVDLDFVPETGCLSIVVVGASGDLAKKKTFPALFNLYRQNLDCEFAAVKKETEDQEIPLGDQVPANSSKVDLPMEYVTIAKLHELEGEANQTKAWKLIDKMAQHGFVERKGKRVILLESASRRKLQEINKSLASVNRIDDEDGLIACSLKRRRLKSFDPMEAEIAKTKLAAVAEELGREIRVFETSAISLNGSATMNDDEPDDSYNFTAEDYYRVLSTRKEGRRKVPRKFLLSIIIMPLYKFLKTRKIREAEEAARRSRITKAIIRIHFPDNCTLEVTFLPSETLQSLIDLLMKVVARPELPFYIYTTPPKKQIVDMSQDFYAAGFVPGANVYFSYDVQKETFSPFLRDEIMCLKGLDVLQVQAESVQSAVEPSPVVQEHKAVGKKPVKPKWLKM